MALLPCLLFASCLQFAASAKFLLLPIPWPSVVRELVHIGDELLTRNHEIHVLLPTTYPAVDKLTESRPNLKVLTYATKRPDLFSAANDDPTILFDMLVKKEALDMRKDAQGAAAGRAHCANVLEDTEMQQKVAELKFDLVLLTGQELSRCYFILPYRLDIPFIAVTTEMEPWVTRTPSLPSFVPNQMQYPPLTPRMTFWERLTNFIAHVSWVLYVDQLPMASDELITKYAPGKPPVSMNYLAGQSLLWLIDNDLVIDYPRPMMPNEINIGGLSLIPVKPLSPDLQAFVMAAKKGIIIATFGSVAVIPEYIMLKIIAGLKLLPMDYHIIVRWHLPDVPDVPANIKLMKYVPQNDLLAHPKTKLFVTHCGANGHFEALSHGVPMVNIPVFYDQIYNAKRADYHGFSKTLSILDFTPDELRAVIQDIMGDNTYKEKISRASAIFSSQPMGPRQRAAFWVEHVLAYGGDHLRSHALDMPAYQYLMIDIAGFIVAGCILGIWAMWMLFRVSKKLFGL